MREKNIQFALFSRPLLTSTAKTKVAFRRNSSPLAGFCWPLTGIIWNAHNTRVFAESLKNSAQSIVSQVFVLFALLCYTCWCIACCINDIETFKVTHNDTTATHTRKSTEIHAAMPFQRPNAIHDVGFPPPPRRGWMAARNMEEVRLCEKHSLRCPKTGSSRASVTECRVLLRQHRSPSVGGFDGKTFNKQDKNILL